MFLHVMISYVFIIIIFIVRIVTLPYMHNKIMQLVFKLSQFERITKV